MKKCFACFKLYKLFFTEFVFCLLQPVHISNNPSSSFKLKLRDLLEREWQLFLNNFKEYIAIGISLLNLSDSFICYFFIPIEV